jgi:hypothetical protein
MGREEEREMKKQKWDISCIYSLLILFVMTMYVLSHSIVLQSWGIPSPRRHVEAFSGISPSLDRHGPATPRLE